MLRTSCEFCRRRKIKCTGELTGCTACVERSQTCSYEPTAPMGRPRKKPRRDSDASESTAPVEKGIIARRGTEPSAAPPPLRKRPTRQRKVRKMSHYDESSEGEAERDDDDDDLFEDDDDDEEYGQRMRKHGRSPAAAAAASSTSTSTSASATPAMSLPKATRPTPMPIQLPQRMSGERPFAPSYAGPSTVSSSASSSLEELSTGSLNSNSSSSLVSPPPHSAFAFDTTRAGSTSALHHPLTSASASASATTPAPYLHNHSLSTHNVLQSAFGLRDAGWPTPLEEKIDAFRPSTNAAITGNLASSGGGSLSSSMMMMMMKPSPAGLTPGLFLNEPNSRMFADLYGLPSPDLTAAAAAHQQQPSPAVVVPLPSPDVL